MAFEGFCGSGDYAVELFTQRIIRRNSDNVSVVDVIPFFSVKTELEQPSFQRMLSNEDLRLA
jgi:hypothetical protein